MPLYYPQRWDYVTPNHVRAKELCESGGGHPGLPDPNSPYSLYPVLCSGKAAYALCSTMLLVWHWLLSIPVNGTMSYKSGHHHHHQNGVVLTDLGPVHSGSVSRDDCGPAFQHALRSCRMSSFSLMGSNTMVGQPALTSLSQECTCVEL